MAEAVGVVAAALQLSATCLSILEFIKKVQEGPAALRDYQNQLEQVRGISKAVSSNPLLQTPEVAALTGSLLEIINKNNIKSLIQRRRIPLSLLFLLKEKEILDASASLERTTTYLTLIVNNLLAHSLYRLECNMAGKSTSGNLDYPQSNISSKSCVESNQYMPSPDRLSGSTATQDSTPHSASKSPYLRLRREATNSSANEDSHWDEKTQPASPHDYAQPGGGFTSTDRLQHLLALANTVRDGAGNSTILVGNTASGGCDQFIGHTVLNSVNKPKEENGTCTFGGGAASNREMVKGAEHASEYGNSNTQTGPQIVAINQSNAGGNQYLGLTILGEGKPDALAGSGGLFLDNSITSYGSQRGSQYMGITQRDM